MEIFLDTANIDEIRSGRESGVVSGITTNPTIISREKKPLRTCLREIREFAPELTIFAEINYGEKQKMIDDSLSLSREFKDVVVKLPMTIQGIAATRELARMNVRTAVTLVFSLNQAILASCSGAEYVAIFVGRLDDVGELGVDLVRAVKETFQRQGVNTKIVAASIRSSQKVGELIKAGCDVVTMPRSVFETLSKHPLTDTGLKKFSQDWIDDSK